MRPRCGQDRFKCADGNGCIPKRWVCDGKAECRDGSDETSCEQRDCSESDFKCGNGICIPKVWRCDKQFDCRDGSDERNCVYLPANSSTAAPEVVVATQSAAPSIHLAPESIGDAAANYYATSGAEQPPPSQQQTPRLAELETPAGRQQLEASLSVDVSRIIQHETAAASVAPPQQQAAAQTQAAEQVTQQATTTLASTTTAAPEVARLEMKKFDYDMIQSAASNLAQLNELAAPSGANARQQQVGQQAARQQQQPAEQKPLGAATQPAAPQRVPIYRSLFKTFKSGNQLPIIGAGHQQNGRNVVAIARRRRDRQQAAAVASDQQQHWPANNNNNNNNFGGAEQQVPQAAAPRQHNQTSRQTAANVASYLQLLNGRYNLRMPQRT